MYKRQVLTRAAMDELRARCTQELLEASKRIREEPQPAGDTIWKHVFADRDLVHEAADRVSHGKGERG